MSRDSSGPLDAATTDLKVLSSPGHSVRGFRLQVVKGPDLGTSWESRGERATVGVNPGCDLVLHDDSVSRFHCELLITRDGVQIRDLGSRNDTWVDGLHVNDAFLRQDSVIRLGRTKLQFGYLKQQNKLMVSERESFGRLVGRSVTMRSKFAILERAARTDITLLLQGETGTGKTELARAIHEESPRHGGPFTIVNCNAIPSNLLESELFGHERGAFTGAEQRVGMFEQASGGTLFLDEIGEIPPELQTKLLTALEDRTIRRLGSNQARPIDVRIIAATHRDLRSAVNREQFREDLYYRLAVVTLRMPSLRERLDDLPLIAERLLTRMGASAEDVADVLTRGRLREMRDAAWPGNIRELRNYLERALVFRDLVADDDDAVIAAPDQAGPPASIAVDASLPFSDARQAVLDAFERDYLSQLLRAHDGKISRAAAAAGIDRTYIYKMLRRHASSKDG